MDGLNDKRPGHEIQIQTKLDQPSRNKGQHQTTETRPQLRGLEL